MSESPKRSRSPSSNNSSSSSTVGPDLSLENIELLPAHEDIEQDKKNILAAINGASNIEPSRQYNPVILKEVGINIKEFLKNNHLAVDRGSEAVEWNDTYKCWEYCVTIHGDGNDFDPYITPEKATRVQPSLEGRVIRVKIFNEQSNTTHNSQDYINRADNLINSGIDLIRKIYGDLTQVELNIKELEEYRKFLQDKLKLLDPHNEKHHELATQAFQVLNSKIAMFLQKLQQNSYGDSSKEALEQLGYINSAVDRRCNKDLPNNEQDWLKILEAHEARFIAAIKRDLLINVYQAPQEQQKDIWTINYNIPLSDVPSTLRNAAGKMLANWFRTVTKTFRVSGQALKELSSFTAERSSSISALSITKDKRESYTREMAENKLRTLIRDKIIAKLNQAELTSDSGDESSLKQLLDGCFSQDLLLMTLLNLPLKHKQEKGRIPEEFSEFPQFIDAKRAFEAIGSLKLEDSDIEYIKDHVRVRNISTRLVAYLKDQEIKHNTVFHNFASSGVKFLSRQEVYNAEALLSMKQWMKEYLADKSIDLDDAILNNPKKLNDLYNATTTSAEVKKTLSLYIRYLKLFKEKSNAPKNNYLRQTFTALLANRLGKEVHITCKSGEDRTGAVFVAIDCALASFERLGLHEENFNIHDKNIWNRFKEDFLGNYIRTEELSASRDITDMNSIGARGIQSQASRLVTLFHKHFHISNKIAKISKSAFKKYIDGEQRNKVDRELKLLTPKDGSDLKIKLTNRDITGLPVIREFLEVLRTPETQEVSGYINGQGLLKDIARNDITVRDISGKVVFNSSKHSLPENKKQAFLGAVSNGQNNLLRTFCERYTNQDGFLNLAGTQILQNFAKKDFIGNGGADRKISFSIIDQGVIEIIEELKIKEINKPQEDGDLVATKGDVKVRLISRIDATDAVRLEDVKFIPRELTVQADNPDDPIFQAYKEVGRVITDEVIIKLEKELMALLEIAKKSKHKFKENVDLLTNLLVYIKTNKNELTQDLAKTGRAKIIHDLNSLKTDDKTKKARIERLIDSITVTRYIEVAPVTPGYASAKPGSPRRSSFKPPDKKFGK